MLGIEPIFLGSQVRCLLTIINTHSGSQHNDDNDDEDHDDEEEDDDRPSKFKQYSARQRLDGPNYIL